MATPKFNEFKQKILTECFEEPDYQQASRLLTLLFGQVDQTQLNRIDSSANKLIKYLKQEGQSPMERLTELQLSKQSSNNPEQYDLQDFRGPISSSSINARCPTSSQYGTWTRPKKNDST